MKNERNVYEFALKGDYLLMHKFNGLDQEKEIKAFPEREQAEKHAYRDEDGELYVPCEWIRGSLIGAFMSRAASKEKTKTKVEVSPRIAVSPPHLLLGKKTYEVDVRSVPAGNMSRGGVRDMCCRPLISDWKVSGKITSTLDKNEKDMKAMLEIAGEDVGIGGNRINGFGRFTVTSFKKVTT